MKNCWVAVDKDGTEKISNSVLFRRKGIASIFWGFFIINRNMFSKNNKNKWCNTWSSNDNNHLPFDGVILPKGTIEKIISKKLGWEDEPVEILNN